MPIAMLRHLVSLFSGRKTTRRANELLADAERMPITTAAPELLNWMRATLDECSDADEALTILDGVTPGLRRLVERIEAEVVANRDNPVKSALLLQSAVPLANLMRDAYFRYLHHSMAAFLRSHAIERWTTSMNHYLIWCIAEYTLAHLTPPAPQGFDWHRICPLLDPLWAALQTERTQKERVSRQLGWLLLLVRSLSTELAGPQILVAARLVRRLHGAVVMSEQFNRSTPFAVSLNNSNPPTMLDSDDRPPRDDHRLFFGLERAMAELVALEHQLMEEESAPKDILVSPEQTAAETLAVIRLLRNRWSGRPATRKAQRVTTEQPAEFSWGFRPVIQALKTEKGLITAHGYPLQVGMQVDVSASGAALVVDTPAPWAKVGELMVIRPQGTEHWLLAMVRRVSPQSSDKLLVGVQTLSLAPQVLRLSMAYDPDNDETLSGLHDVHETCEVIYLAAAPGTSAQAALLAEPKHLIHGRLYVTQAGTPKQYVRIGIMLDMGSDYVRYAGDEESAPTVN